MMELAKDVTVAPVTNEAQTAALFARMAGVLGYTILEVQQAFPDALLYSHKDRREVRAEFEYRSTNFVKHGHDPAQAGLIICFIHDWYDAPIPVLELSSELPPEAHYLASWFDGYISGLAKIVTGEAFWNCGPCKSPMMPYKIGGGNMRLRCPRCGRAELYAVVPKNGAAKNRVPRPRAQMS